MAKRNKIKVCGYKEEYKNSLLLEKNKTKVYDYKLKI